MGWREPHGGFHQQHFATLARWISASIRECAVAVENQNEYHGADGRMTCEIPHEPYSSSMTPVEKHGYSRHKRLSTSWGVSRGHDTRCFFTRTSGRERSVAMALNQARGARGSRPSLQVRAVYATSAWAVGHSILKGHEGGIDRG